MHGAGYDVGCRFARGGIGLFWFDPDGTVAERAELIAIILNVSAAMHIFRCIHNIRIDR